MGQCEPARAEPSQTPASELTPPPPTESSRAWAPVRNSHLPSAAAATIPPVGVALMASRWTLLRYMIGAQLAQKNSFTAARDQQRRMVGQDSQNGVRQL